MPALLPGRLLLLTPVPPAPSPPPNCLQLKLQPYKVALCYDSWQMRAQMRCPTHYPTRFPK